MNAFLMRCAPCRAVDDLTHCARVCQKPTTNVVHAQQHTYAAKRARECAPIHLCTRLSVCTAQVTIVNNDARTRTKRARTARMRTQRSRRSAATLSPASTVRSQLHKRRARKRSQFGPNKPATIYCRKSVH